MKRVLLSACAVLMLTAGMSWAGVVGSTDPSLFTDLVDWCQFDCVNNNGASFGTPTAFSSVGGSTGWVGLTGADQFLLSVNGNGWFGNFSDGMGVLFNNETQEDFALAFDQGQFGFGAYVQSDYYGPYTATVTLYDINDLELGSFTADGTASGADDGSALFIGAYDTSADVYAAVFDVVGTGENEPDFALGEGGFYLPSANTPEPGTLLMIAPALLGLAAYGRKRISKSAK